MSKCNHENERTKDTHNIAPVNAQRRQWRPNAELCTKARSEMQNPDPNQLNPDTPPRRSARATACLRAHEEGPRVAEVSRIVVRTKLDHLVGL